MHRLQEFVRLHRLGTGAREVARLLQMSPNTERSYRQALEAAGLLQGPVSPLPPLDELKAAVQAQRPRPAQAAHEMSSIEAWQEQVKALWEKGMTARPIYDRLRQEDGSFHGSYWAVKRLCRRLAREQGVRAEDVAIPVETGPGEVAQIDFGYAGRLLCPETHVLRHAWVFVMVLGYSRHMFAEVVFDQKATTWLQLHRRAFEAFGGAVQTLVPDNLKAAVLRAAFAVDGDSALHRSYRELARHYGCKVDPTPPYAPRKKGKVESSVKYVKRNALAGRHGEDITAVNRALQRWCLEVAGTRTHGTTGEQPLALFRQEEQAALRPLPGRPYEPTLWQRAKVHQDTHICFEGKLYSVPWRWVGQHVWVQATATTVAIFGDDVRIATHARVFRGKRSTIESHLPEHRRDMRHRSCEYWRDRAARIGAETAGLVDEIFASDDVLSQLRKVQCIVTHLEGFPTSRAEAASRRARFFGTYSYQGVKAILAKALDFEPLPEVLLPAREPGERPRFARSVAELLASQMEVSHESH
jgi:transposase